MSNKEDLTMEELTEIVDALGSAVRAQQPVNQAVYDRMTEIETVVNRIGDTQVKILERQAALEDRINKLYGDGAVISIQSNPSPSKPIIDWG